MKKLNLLEYLCGVIFGLDLLGCDDAFDDAVGRDDESGAERAHIFSPVHRFLAPDAEFFDKTGSLTE